MVGQVQNPKKLSQPLSFPLPPAALEAMNLLRDVMPVVRHIRNDSILGALPYKAPLVITMVRRMRDVSPY